MKTSKKGIELIMKYEGLELKSYYCPAGVLTIGYGHTGKDVYEEQTITEKEAECLLINDLKSFELMVSRWLKIAVNQNQFDALVSHTYNTGGSETLFRLINKKSPQEQIKSWFTEHYIIGGGVILEGLKKRRNEESNIYYE